MYLLSFIKLTIISEAEILNLGEEGLQTPLRIQRKVRAPETRNYIHTFKVYHLWVPGYKPMSSSEIGIISLLSLMSKHKCSGTELPQTTKLVMDGSSNTTSELVPLNSGFWLCFTTKTGLLSLRERKFFPISYLTCTRNGEAHESGGRTGEWPGETSPFLATASATRAVEPHSRSAIPDTDRFRSSYPGMRFLLNVFLCRLHRLFYSCSTGGFSILPLAPRWQSSTPLHPAASPWSSRGEVRRGGDYTAQPCSDHS